MKKPLTIVLLSLTSHAFADLSNLRTAITRADQKIIEAQGYLSRTETEAQQNRTKAGSLNADAGTFGVNEQQYRTEYSQNSLLNKATIAEGEVLATEVTKLMQNIALEDYNIGNLEQVDKRLQQINADEAAITKSFALVLQSFKEYDDLHRSWIQDVNSQIESNRPDFDKIIDKNSYVKAYREVLDSSTKYPSMGDIISLENQLTVATISLISTIEGLQRKIRESAPSVTFATYIKLSRKNQLHNYRELDKNNQDFILKLSQITNALSSARKVRSDIIFKITNIWLQMIRVKISMNNIHQLLDTSAEITRLFLSHEAYGRLRGAFEQKKTIVSKLGDDTVPYLFAKAINDAEAYALQAKQIIPTTNLSQSVRAEITALINDQISYLDSMTQMAQSMISQSSDYLSERKRFVRNISKKNEFVASPTCKKKAKAILDNSVPDIDSEIDYLDYRNLCT